MSATNIYIIRHGQSQGNLKDWFVGHSDIELTELGLQQAEMTADFLDGISVDAIYSSDLSRAIHTAQATAKRKNLPVITDPGLREIFGGKWECQEFLNLGTCDRDAFQIWLHDFGNAVCPDGESVLEVQKRVYDTVEGLAKENAGKTICIFSHGVAIRVLTAKWMGLSTKQLHHHPYASNASVTHATYEDGKFTLLEYSRDDFMGDKVTRLIDDQFIY